MVFQYVTKSVERAYTLLSVERMTNVPLSPTRSLLRVEEVADLLNVRASTVYEWARMNYIPHVRLGVGSKKPCIRFDAEEISRWLTEKKTAGRMTRVPAVTRD